MRLLYIDDDRVHLLLFEHAAAGVPGLELRCAGDAAEALALAAEFRPEHLLIDRHLGADSGLTLFAALRNAAEAGSPMSAHLCSAEIDPALEAEARAHGFQGCVAKPVVPRDIWPPAP